MEAINRHQNFLGENRSNTLALLTDTAYPRILVTMGGVDSFREPMELDAEEFIGVKGFKARGKRITTLHVDKVEELPPLRQPEAKDCDGGDGDDQSGLPDSGQEETEDPDEGKSQQDIVDELNGQLHLF